MKHPLHPALVHFPVACWSLATAADLAGLRWGQASWHLAGVLMAIGTTLAVAAMAAGVVEWAKLGADDPALGDVHRHMILAGTAWSCYFASLLLRLQVGPVAPPGTVALALSVAGFLVLCATGWIGGKLVYVHGVGVRRRS